MDLQEVGTVAQVFVGLLIASAIELKAFSPMIFPQSKHEDPAPPLWTKERMEWALRFYASICSFLGMIASALGLMLCIGLLTTGSTSEDPNFPGEVPHLVTLGIGGTLMPPLSLLVATAIRSSKTLLTLSAMIAAGLFLLFFLTLRSWLFPG